MSKLPAGPDNFEVTLTEQIRGYFSSIDPTIAPPDVLVRGSQNVYKTSNNTIANRFGRKQYDVIDSTLAGVKAGYVWNTSLGATRILDIANGKLEVVSDIVTSGTFVHYTLMTVTPTRGVFDPWWNNTLKKDQLIFVLGDTSLYMWHGGMGKIASTTVNTIVLTTTIASSGFNTTSGSVLINGNTYTYSGSSGSTLTGVSGNPTGEANGSVVISAVVTTATTPSTDATTFTNDFIKVIRNMLYVGSYLSRLIYISSNSDYTSFTGTIQSPSRVPGGNELLVLDNPAKGIGLKGSSTDGIPIIFAGTSDLYIVNFNQITVGSTLTEQTTVDKKNLGINGSAYAHEFIDSLNDTIFWLSQNQQVKTFGTYSSSLNQQFPSISNEVSTDLVNQDFTLGQLKIISSSDRGDILYLIAPNTGVVYLYQMRQMLDKNGTVVSERLWHAPFVWGISRIDAIGTSEIGFSNSNPQIYTLWDTLQWHDDGASAGSATQLAFTSIALFPYRSYGRRQGKVKFDKVYWEGYITQGTSLYSAIYYDYQGATAILAPIIHSIIDNSPAKDASFFTGITPPSLGDASLGDNPLGDVTAVINFGESIRDHDLLPKFRIITDVPIIHCFEVALMCFTQRIDDRWELIANGANISEAEFSAVEIRK